MRTAPGQPGCPCRLFPGTDIGYFTEVTLSLARRERSALCETARSVGPTAPTLCDGWSARDLLSHLIVREHGLLAAAGIPFAPLAPFTERAMTKTARRPYDELVARVQDRGLTPYRLPGVDRLANTLEYFVHHEDLRRAQPSWEPRTLPAADEDELWSQLKLPAKLSARKAGVPLTLARSDRTAQTMVLRDGDGAVTVTGRPSELVELMFGRQQLRDLTYDGPAEAVATFKAADLSA